MKNEQQPPKHLREGVCKWYLLCENEATTFEKHPVLKTVAICERCKAKNERLRA
jgi:hypothetical protein